MSAAGSLAIQIRTVGASRPNMRPTCGTPVSGGSRAKQAYRHSWIARDAWRPVSASSASSVPRHRAGAAWAILCDPRRLQNTPGPDRVASPRGGPCSTSYSSQR